MREKKTPLEIGGDRGGDHPRVEAEDVLLGGALPEEALHREPRGVHVAHRAHHALEHISDGLRRRLERGKKNTLFFDIWEKWGRHIWGKGVLGFFTFGMRS